MTRLKHLDLSTTKIFHIKKLESKWICKMFYTPQIRRQPFPVYSQCKDLESGYLVPPESPSVPQQCLGRGKHGSGN